jgi:hypothetical protein
VVKVATLLNVTMHDKTGYRRGIAIPVTTMLTRGSFNMYVARCYGPAEVCYVVDT